LLLCLTYGWIVTDTVAIVKRSIILDRTVLLLLGTLTGGLDFGIMDLFESRTGVDVAAVC